MENMIENNRVSRKIESMFSSIRSDSNSSESQLLKDDEKKDGAPETGPAEDDASVTY